MANTKAEIQQIPWKVPLKQCTQFHPTQVYIFASLNRSSNTNQGSIYYQYFREKMDEIEQTFVNNMCSIISEGNVVVFIVGVLAQFLWEAQAHKVSGRYIIGNC